MRERKDPYDFAREYKGEEKGEREGRGGEMASDSSSPRPSFFLRFGLISGSWWGR